MKRLGLAPLVMTIAAAAAVAAAAAPAPATTPGMGVLSDRIIADAAALRPDGLAFDRTTHAVRTGGGTTSTVNTADRWTGKRWILLNSHNRQPSATERSDHKRRADAMPVPGYYQL
ncbi:MAG: hypothetical protein H7267_07695, partial [Sandarakinorhabdus sp.]|nr:hypothetical protein [Sandarakinorhabdus sp.]